jgi:methylmalonyl-CoA mutase N-terminal domain/subunit
MAYRDHSDAEGNDETVTRDGIVIKPVYDADDVLGAEIGAPGEFPFTRGIFAPADRPRSWRAEHYAGFGSASESKERFAYLKRMGTSGGMSIALDMPTQVGLDSDHPLAAGEVGHVGVAIDTLADVEELFSGSRLDEVKHVFCTANSIAPIILAMILAAAQKQGVSPDSFTVQLQNDSLKEYFARGTQIYPVQDALRLSADTIEYCTRHLPEWSPLSISGAHMRGAGATALQELTYTICDGLAYVEEVTKRGVDIDTLAPNLELHFTVQMDLFEEVAKLRAARRIWAKLMRERFGATSNVAMAAWITTATSGVTLTAQEPLNNIIRTTTETIAAILGGANNHRVASYDEALSIPTKDSARIATRIPQILTLEAELTSTADPLGGSYFVESLTSEMESRFWQEFAAIEERGGAVAAIEDGYFFRNIVQSALRWQEDFDSGALTVVAVNRYHENADDIPPEIFEGDPDAERRQVERLHAVKASRDQAAVDASLVALAEATARGDNVVPTVLDAVRAYATVGEICEVWSKQFGSWDAAANAL